MATLEHAETPRQRRRGDDLEFVRHPNSADREGAEEHRRREQCRAFAGAKSRQRDCQRENHPEDGLGGERRALEFEEPHHLLHVQVQVQITQVESRAWVQQKGNEAAAGEKQLDAPPRSPERFQAMEREHGSTKSGAGMQIARDRDDADAPRACACR